MSPLGAEVGYLPAAAAGFAAAGLGGTMIGLASGFIGVCGLETVTGRVAGSVGSCPRFGLIT